MKKKKITQSELTGEEQMIEESLERGNWVSASKSFRAKIEAGAKESSSKRNREARVNIRLRDETLKLLQSIADEEGIGYQTLMGSVLHKFAHGKLINSDDVKKVVNSLNLKKKVL